MIIATAQCLISLNISIHLKGRCFVVNEPFRGTWPGGCHVCFGYICHVTDHLSDAADSGKKVNFMLLKALQIESAAAKTFTTIIFFKKNNFYVPWRKKTYFCQDVMAVMTYHDISRKTYYDISRNAYHDILWKWMFLLPCIQAIAETYLRHNFFHWSTL